MDHTADFVIHHGLLTIAQVQEILRVHQDRFDGAVNRLESLISAIELLQPEQWTAEVIDLLQNIVARICSVIDRRQCHITIRNSINLPRHTLEYLLEMKLNVPKISKLLNVSVRTVFRRMAAYGLSVRG